MNAESQKTKPLTEAKKDRLQRHAMKARAAILSIEPLAGNIYRVWGGSKSHLVRVTQYGAICDCEGWGKARNHNCSHVMKYRLVYGDLKK